jgi:hypothetical protein
MVNGLHGRHGYPYPMPRTQTEEHVQRHRSYVKRILAKLMEHNLFLKPEKCTFEQPSIKFLGVRITQGEVQMDDSKIEKVHNWRQLLKFSAKCDIMSSVQNLVSTERCSNWLK